MRTILLCLVVLMTYQLSAQTNQNLRASQDKSTGKWGFVGSTGDWAIAPVFDQIGEVYFNSDNVKRDYAPVKIYGGWGCINRKGEFIIKPVFDKYHELFWAGDQWQKQVPPGTKLYALQDSQTAKWGFINHLGNWAILPEFDKVGDVYFTSDNVQREYAPVMIKGKWGCVDRKGEFIVKPVFDKYAEAFWAGDEVQKSANYVKVAPFQVPNFADKDTNGIGFKPEQASSSTSAGTNAKPVTAEVTKSSANDSTNTSVASQSETSAPTLVILSPENGAGYTNSEVTLRYQSKTFDNSQPELLISLNGEPYDKKTKGVKRAFDEVTIFLPAKEGRCNIQLIAKDSNGKLSEPAYLSLNYTGEKQKPVLHVLAIGVGKYADPAIDNLDYAAKDAIDFAALISGFSTEHYRKIETPVVLTDEKATTINIKKSITDLTRNVEQEDVVFLFFSGHGDGENKENYFLSADAQSDDLYSTAVNFSDIRLGMSRLTDKHCRVITFMDACYAGALHTKSISQTLQFAAPGVISYYSSTGNQKSIEDAKSKNGYFTRALIDGIKGNAKDKNGNITTLELERYIKETVTEETGGKQTPIIENKLGNLYCSNSDFYKEIDLFIICN